MRQCVYALSKLVGNVKYLNLLCIDLVITIAAFMVKNRAADVVYGSIVELMGLVKVIFPDFTILKVCPGEKEHWGFRKFYHIQFSLAACTFRT